LLAGGEAPESGADFVARLTDVQVDHGARRAQERDQLAHKFASKKRAKCVFLCVGQS